MAAILVFIVFVIIGDAISLGICMIVEKYSENASLLVFLGLFVGVFVVAWQLAWRFTERYLITPEPPLVELPKPQKAAASRPVAAVR